MPTFMQISIPLFVCVLLASATILGEARASTGSPNAGQQCVDMTVTARDIASNGAYARQQYRIRFENRCDAVRIVYWCAKYPPKTPTTQSPCARTGTSNAIIASPLYEVVRQREFQWAFPEGTRIRYIDCSESTYPTSDFRCRPATAEN